jgi:hypothetical protein
MNYDEIQALENYKTQAKVALATYRREREEYIRTDDERRMREQTEKWDALLLSLAEIIPPALFPLWTVDTDEAPPHSYLDIPFVYDGQTILGLRVHIGANMQATLNDLSVPDARLCKCEDGWEALLTFERFSGPLVEETEGGHFGVGDNELEWKYATTRAFEVLEAYRDYAARAAQHNAELAERRTEEQIIKQVFGADTTGEDVPTEASGEAEIAPTFTVIEDEVIFRFERNVNAHLNDGWQLHGPMQTVAVPPDPRYEDLERYTLYIQALVRPEVA